MLPTPVFWPEEFHGLYSPWGDKELDTTEHLPLSKKQRHSVPTTATLQAEEAVSLLF